MSDISLSDLDTESGIDSQSVTNAQPEVEWQKAKTIGGHSKVGIISDKIIAPKLISRRKITRFTQLDEKYLLPNLPNSCKTTVPRKAILALEKGPGPAAYRLPNTVGSVWRCDPTRSTAPACSLKGRYKYYGKNDGPGPGAYIIPGPSTRTGTHPGREFSLGPKLPPPKIRHQSPAPIYYPKPIGCKRKCTIGEKLKVTSLSKPTPAPNEYKVRSTFGHCLNQYNYANCVSFKSREKFRDYRKQGEITPAPGALPNLDLWKKTSPQFIIGERYSRSSKTTGPGPAAYDVTETVVKKRAPAYQFGCRHSQFIMPFTLSE